MGDTFTCSICHEKFKFIRDETWSEEKAKEEYKQMFPNSDWEYRIVVCDDCWNQIKPEQPWYE